MNRLRAAVLLRKIERYGYVGRGPLHRIARMPATRMRDYAAELWRWAAMDVHEAVRTARDAVRHPKVFTAADVGTWLGAAATWAAASAVCRTVEEER